MHFLLDSLGSMIFWILFFSVSFVAGVCLLRVVAPRTYSWIRTGEKPKSRHFEHLRPSAFELVLIVILVHIFWPILLGAVMLGFGYKVLFKAIPEIEIKRKERKDG